MPSKKHDQLISFGKFILLNSNFRLNEIGTEVYVKLEGNKHLILDVVGVTGLNFEKNKKYDIEQLTGKAHAIECGNLDQEKTTILRMCGIYVTHLPFTTFSREGVSIEVAQEIQKLQEENEKLKEEVERGIIRFKKLKRQMGW